MELTVLKVKIGLKLDGSADYPDFNSMTVVQNSGMDWSKYVDVEGLGWQYDKTSGHQDYSADSPMGQQWGVLIVTEAFVLQALVDFPGVCTRLNETELESFYDNKAHAHESAELRDNSTLENLDRTLNLMEQTGANAASISTFKTKIRNALDSSHAEPGVKKNVNKKWIDLKASKNVTIKDA